MHPVPLPASAPVPIPFSPNFPTHEEAVKRDGFALPCW